MSKHVETACRDCKKCMDSSVAHGGRNLGRGLMAISTAGMSEAGLAMRKKCRLCGHQMSLHHGAEAATVQPAVVVATLPIQASPSFAPSVTPQGPPPGWYQDPDGGPAECWWDGTGWTGVKRTSSTSQVDQVAAMNPQPPAA